MKAETTFTIDAADFLKQSRVRICLNGNCDNNWTHSKTNTGLCNCKEVEIDNEGRCMNFRVRTPVTQRCQTRARYVRDEQKPGHFEGGAWKQ